MTELSAEDMRRFRAGDEDAVRAVYRRYGGAIGTVARSMLRDDELVAEVVQQTFVKAWRAAATFDANRDLAPWLYSIARRTAIDVLKREQRPTQGGHEPETDVAITTMSFDRTWEVFEVRQAIDDLPAEEREVVRAASALGMTHAEIAEHLGIPVGTVKSRMARAHKRLGAALDHLRTSANQIPTSSVRSGENDD